MISEQLLERLKVGEKEAFNDLVQLAVQEALRLLPMAHENIVKQAAVLHKLSKDFYEKHEKLANHKDKVASAIESVEAEFPGLEYEEILNRAANRVYTTLNVSPKVEKTAKHLKELDLTIGNL